MKLCKRLKKNLGIIILIIISLTALAYFSQNKFLTVWDTTCTGSISADITKIERTPGTSTFKIIATANRAGDCLKIAWTKEELNNYLQQVSPDEMLNNGIYADIILNSMNSKFFTSADKDANGQVKTLKKYLVGDHGWTLYGCSVDNCKNSWGYPTTEFYVRQVSYPGPCYCIYTQDDGTFAKFSGTKSRNGQATLKVSGFSDIPFSFGAESGGSVNGANGKISLLWRGDLLGGRWVGAPTSYQAFLEGGNYKMIDLINFDLLKSDSLVFYANGKTDTLQNCLGKQTGWILNNINDAKNCISGYESKLASILINKKSQWEEGTRGSVINSYWSGSDLVAEEQPYSTSFPQFELLINAEWVGVHFVLGRPAVECPSDITFYSGQTYNLNFNVKNIDSSENGAFGISLSCSGGLSPGITLNRVTLSPGQSQSIQAYVTKTVSSETDDKCTINVNTVRPSDRQAQCTFNVKTKPVQVCIPLTKKCSDDLKQLGTCKSDGSDYEWINCDNSCEYIGGGAQCKGYSCIKENGDCKSNSECCSELECKNNKCTKLGEFPKCESCDSYTLSQMIGFIFTSKKCEPQLLALPPQTTITCALSFIRWILIPVILLFTYLFSVPFYTNFKAIKRNKIAVQILSIITSAFLAYIAYILYWLALILFVIFLVLKFYLTPFRLR